MVILKEKSSDSLLFELFFFLFQGPRGAPGAPGITGQPGVTVSKFYFKDRAVLSVESNKRIALFCIREVCN